MYYAESRFSHQIPSYMMSVTKGNAFLRFFHKRECIPKMLFFVWSCSSVNWNLSVGRAVGLSSKEYIGMHSFLWWLILYEGIRCENIYNWFGRIHVLCSLYSFEFLRSSAKFYTKYKTLQCQHFPQTFKNSI
jgi:hypothetical protein